MKSKNLNLYFTSILPIFFYSVDVGAEENNKKNETVRDADIDEQEPDGEKERGKGHESSDDEAVVCSLLTISQYI